MQFLHNYSLISFWETFSFQFFSSIEFGLIYGIVAVGVLISFRVLQFPDLTADGSFPLGAGITAILIINGWNPFFAMILAIIGGMMSGFVTAWLNVRWNILNLLASILTMTALYSVNLRIMGRPNISLLNEKTIFSDYFGFGYSYSVLIILFCITVLVVFLLYRFLSSEIGLALRATGENPVMAQAQGIKTGGQIFLGISISNGLIALSGSLFAQSQGFADITIGVGTIIVGLASVILGESLFRSRSILIIILSVISGSIFYRLMIALALNIDFLGLKTSDLNLITAVLVCSAMILPKLRFFGKI